MILPPVRIIEGIIADFCIKVVSILSERLTTVILLPGTRGVAG